jgi:DNA-binding MarR family transcriptional regulator
VSKSKSAPRLGFLLNRAQRVLQRWTETRADAWPGISSAQVGLLFYLESHPQAMIGEIAAALHVAPAAVTNLSKRMQEAGLIERIADAEDARITRLRLTTEGEDAHRHAHRLLGQMNAHLKNGFSEEELAVVARWLQHAATLYERDD